MQKRDLRAELLAAEQEAKNKKRKAEGKPPLPIENGSMDEEANKRRKLLQEALELDKDDDEDEKNEKTAGQDKDEGEEGDRCEFFVDPLQTCRVHACAVMKTLMMMMMMTRPNFSVNLKKSNVNEQKTKHGRSRSSLPLTLQLERLRSPQETLFSTLQLRWDSRRLMASTRLYLGHFQ